MSNLTHRQQLQRTREHLRRQKNRRAVIHTYVYDIWWSDGNDRHCIGAVRLQSRETRESAAYDALDIALDQYAAKKSEWDSNMGDASASLYSHDSYCDCYCHTSHEDYCPSSNSHECTDECIHEPEPPFDCECAVSDNENGCENCGRTEYISIEDCVYHGVGHYWAHRSLEKDEQFA